MNAPSELRAKAAKYAELAKFATGPETMREFQQLMQSYETLADNEQWMNDHRDETVHGPIADADAAKLARTVDKLSLAVEEEQILRHLGAALLMRWNTLPPKLQRELFDTAGTMGEILDAAPLRKQIALFLHKHKDDV